MAALHDALKTLSPTAAADLPAEQDLAGYLANCLQDTHVLVCSVPAPVGASCPQPSDPALQVLQKEWRPVKMGAKENPLGFAVYKLPSKDGRGTWFARRSVHEELGFKRFRAGLQREFEIGEQAGSSVRGCGRERQIDRKRCPLGQAEVNYLTAQFPGPSAPRDFVTASLTSSAHPDDIAQNASYSTTAADSPARSRSSSGASSSEPKPRQFTMISRPLTDHPECEERQGYVRGQFESIEFIREIPAVCKPPINRRSVEVERDGMRRVMSVPNVPSLEQQQEEERSAGRKRGRTITFADGRVPGEDERSLSPRVVETNAPLPHPEQNPVEWIMITRSDPGGSVPRWMVERGTPGGIIKDAEKFLEWAAKKHELDEEYPDEVENEYEETMEGARVGDSLSMKEGRVPGQEMHKESKKVVVDTSTETEESLEKSAITASQENPGLISSALSTVSAGVSMLAPSVITSTSSAAPSPVNGTTSTTSIPSPQNDETPTTTVPNYAETVPTGTDADPDDDDDDDEASIASFATARSNDPDNFSLVSGISSSTTPTTHASTHEEKALVRLLREKAKLTEKLERQRSRERKKRSKDDEREQKLLEKHMREVEKREARYNKEIEKAKKREEKKVAKQTKEQRELEELKKVVEGLTKENLRLREKVEELEGREKRGVEKEGRVGG